MRAPMHQNAAQGLISVLFLALYTAAVNTPNPEGDIDVVEGILYAFTFGFICDELTKFWKAGYHILGFWNALNFVLYSLLATSFAVRCIALGHDLHDGDGVRQHFNTLGYNFLAVSAPLFWVRLLLYLDSFRFFGAMLVVLKVMMRESIIFFALLAVVVVGFLQSFSESKRRWRKRARMCSNQATQVGLDSADDQVAGDMSFIITSMANAIMQSPDFSGFDKFQHPFGLVLYYCFTFIVMVSVAGVYGQDVNGGSSKLRPKPR